MRYKRKLKPRIKENDIRIKTGFLLLPKCIDGEWRWLEFTRWEQTVRKLTSFIPECSTGFSYLKWINSRWV